MPVTRIRPNGINTAFYPNRTAATGGTANAVTADQSDATYIRKSITNTAPMIVLALADYTLAVGHDLIGVAPGLRYKRPDTLGLAIAQAVIGYRSGVPYLRQGTYSILANRTVAGDASAARQAALESPSSLMLCIKDGSPATSANRATVYEAYMDVYALARPTVTLTVNGGVSPVVTTSFPSIVVTVSALIEAWQGAAYADGEIEVRIYSQSQYDAVGFNPISTKPYWSSVSGFSALPYGDGVAPSTQAVTFTPEYPLTPTGNFRVYTRAKRAGATTYGAQVYASFAMNLPSLAAPFIEHTLWSSPTVVLLQSVVNVTTGHTNALADFERRLPNGDWLPLWDATAFPGRIVGSQHACDVYDSTPPTGATIEYRTRVASTFAGQRVLSGWSNTLSVEIPTVPGWMIITRSALGSWGDNPAWPQAGLLNYTRTIYGAGVLKNPDYVQTEDVAVFRPKGRKFPVVVSGALGGADGSMIVSGEIGMTTGPLPHPSVWSCLQAIRDYQEPIFIASPFGWSKWIRIIGRSWVEMGTASAPRHRVKFDFVEVEEP